MTGLRPRTTTLLALGALAVAVATVVIVSLGGDESGGDGSTDVTRTPERKAAGPVAAEASLSDVGRESIRDEAGSSVVDEAPVATDSPTAPVAAESATEYALRLQFVDPVRRPITLETATVRLSTDDGAVRSFSVNAQTECRTQVPFGVYRLEVDAPPYRHVAETLDLSSERAFENGSADDGFFARVTLWTEGCIPVRLVRSDGRSFVTITEELGLEPRRLFWVAFELATRRSPIDPDVPPDEQDEGLATFQRPTGGWNVRVIDDGIGSLVVNEAGPFWVGLWIHGRFHGSELWSPSDQEVVFVADPDDFDARMCTVKLRLLDRDSGEPLSKDVSVELKAEHSSHRRRELQDRAPNEDGTIVFTGVVPGSHDLLIRRGGSFVQRDIDLETAEERDLGDIKIGDDPPIEVLVATKEGEPLRAAIEITPYVAGGETRDLYHPNLHRWADRAGRYELPVPESRSIVRARPIFDHDDASSSYLHVGTHNVLVDPASPPTKLELVAIRPSSVSIVVESPWADGHRVDVIDTNLELIVESFRSSGTTHWIVPGRYLARHVDASGEVVGERWVDIAEGQASISVP